jgi:hypothetical protein
MKKRDIKVVKRDSKPALQNVPEPIVEKKKSAADEEREMVDSIKGWITEHAESKVKRSDIGPGSSRKKGRF